MHDNNKIDAKFETKASNMVTTIKITGDGVFIQTNSNRIHTTDERIVTDSSINVINGTSPNSNNNNNHHQNRRLHHHRHHRLSNGHAIDDVSNKISNGISKRSISVQNIDIEPQSLPNLPIVTEPPALISPQLVKTLSRIKKPTTTTTAEAEAEAALNKFVINGLSTSTGALSSISTSARSIHKVIRVDKSGKCSAQRTTPASSVARQWDGGGGGGGVGGCTTAANKMKNGTVSTGSGVRRRNTFKSYLIECKENIVRRLSSPTPLIG